MVGKSTINDLSITSKEIRKDIISPISRRYIINEKYTKYGSNFSK